MSQAAALPDVIRDIERVARDVVAEAAKFPSPILADVAGRRGALSGRIAPLAPSMKFAGPAITGEQRITLSPHIGGVTADAYVKMGVAAAQNALAVLNA